jgi:hypothetical protein
MDVLQLSEFLFEKFGGKIQKESIKSALNDYHRHHLDFVSDAAKRAYVDAKQPDGIIPTGKNGMVTVADIKKAAGFVPKGVNKPTPWGSAAAKHLAEEHNLTGTTDEFPFESRTGRTLKDGNFIKISVADVKLYVIETLGIKPDPTFSSPSVKTYADEENVKITDFAKGTRITKAVVDAKVKELIDSGKLELVK